MESKPFLLRPGTPKEGKPREPRPGEVEGQLAEPLKTYAEEAGLVMRRPSKIAYSVYALQASEYAKEVGRFDAFHLGMYKAYWERGEDIGDLDVIRHVAEDCGMDWSELGPRLESDKYEIQVSSQYTDAMNLGIQGIPGFLIDKYLFTGARPYEVFKAVMAKVLAERAGEATGEG